MVEEEGMYFFSSFQVFVNSYLFVLRGLHTLNAVLFNNN